MPRLQVHQLSEDYVYRDVIMVNEEHRKDKLGRTIKEGQVCLVRANGHKCLAVLRGYQTSNEPHIRLDEYTREKLKVQKNEVHDFELKRVGFFGQLCWAWNATEMGYQISSRLAVFGFILGIFGLILGFAKFLPLHPEWVGKVLHFPEMYDAVLIGIAAFLNLGLTYAGLRVAVRPVEDEKKKKGLLTICFVVCAVALIIAVWIAARGIDAQTSLQRTAQRTDVKVDQVFGILTSVQATVASLPPGNSGPVASKPTILTQPPQTGFLQFAQFQYVTGDEFFTVDKPLQLNVYYVNKGQAPAKNAYSSAVLALANRGNEPQKVLDETVLRALEPQARALTDNGVTLGVGNYSWTSPSLSVPLKQEVVDGIRQGKIILYVLSYARWRDAQGKPNDVLDCFWLNPPLSERPELHSLVWHFCAR